jgi:hypothetical protein
VGLRPAAMLVGHTRQTSNPLAHSNRQAVRVSLALLLGHAGSARFIETGARGIVMS